MNWKEAETQVKDRLNTIGGDFNISTKQFDTFDVYGRDEKGVYTLVEVKLRNKFYGKWMMQCDKAERLLQLKDEHNEEINLYYAVMYDDVCKVYDVMEIIKNETTSIRAGKTTVFSDKTKTNKESYLFDDSSYLFKL